MNKKCSLHLLLIASLSNILMAQTPVCPSHVFVPRGASTDLAWIDSLTFYNRTRQYPHKCYIYTSMTIYEKSTRNKRFASSFLLGDGNNFITVEQAAPGAPVINSLELALANPTTPFASTLTINPNRRQFTYLGNMYFNFENWWCGLWGDVTFGVTNVRHRLNCCEVGNTSTICPGITNISTALGNNSQLLFSKFYCGTCADGKRRTGFEDIQLRLGYDYLWCNENRFGIYLIGTIPAGRRPTAEFIFEPLVGSRHGSFGVGFLGDYEVTWCGCGDDSSFTLMTDFNYRYVFSHRECRTFDLMPNGPFSRYLLIVDSSALGFPFPAANATTSLVKIKPRSTIQWWLGFNYEYCDWDFEVGYNLFWREKERLSQPCVQLPTTIGVYNLSDCGASQVTASNATIFSPGTPDIAFVPLTPSNINIDSGLARRLLTNKVYAALSWTGCACNCFEWMAGFGGSYEFVTKHDKCAAPASWAVFSKWAVGF
jgi:hypothetical protein